MQRPNIVFLFCDQQRFDTLGVNGQPLDMTPNLDALAFEGVNFYMLIHHNLFVDLRVLAYSRDCLQQKQGVL